MWLSRLLRPRRVLIVAAVALALLAGQVLVGARSGFVRLSNCDAPAADWSGMAVPVSLETSTATGRDLRVVSYNLHSGLGAGVLPWAPRAQVEDNLRAIARHVAGAGNGPVDAVALNEVDFGSRRSGWIDQAAFLARELRRLTGTDYHVVRGETWRRPVPGFEVRFGNALLTRHPVRSSRSCLLDGSCGRPAERWFGAEPRGVLQVTLDYHGRALDLLVTHLEAFAPGRRERQAVQLREDFVRPGRTTLVLGDMNAVAAASSVRRWFVDDDRTHDILTSGRLQDARVILAAGQGAGDLSSWATYPAAAPSWALDAAFATPELLPLSAAAIGDSRASDHRGLVVEYRWLASAPAARRAQWQARLQQRQRRRLQSCYRPRSPGPALQAIWGRPG